MEINLADNAFILICSAMVFFMTPGLAFFYGGMVRRGNVVHISSGISGLTACIILGKRRGYGMMSYKPHNIPFVVLGAAMLWFGWFGFNAGSALTAGPLAVHAFVTTNTSAGAGMLSWMLVEKIKHGKPTLLGAATGAVLGLVAITPGAGFVPIWSSIICGAVVSPICYFCMGKLKAKLGYDDALDAFGCHGVGGIWGGIATGLFTQKSINSVANWNGLLFGDFKLLAAQVISILITIVYSAVMTFVIMKVIMIFMEVRVEKSEEADGLDIAEHGESAYPAYTGLVILS